jgi:hypothetical protein
VGQFKEKNIDFDGMDTKVLLCGRVFWEGNLMIVVARDANDCEKLPKLKKSGDVIFVPENFPGPVVLIRNFGQTIDSDKIEILGKKYLLRYSKKIAADPLIAVMF